ncbi:S-adenosyl-L-methionine-dependent methyltransferase [Bombardia bombarda]|uniref:S-adenosyl-L-methionine-dependent methyltransferase n=1 Tax=Bombardia bombarda TaxID=252184 RepID=A0AA39X138_9PEZI|nr:S-adenosyl-L-methionine-dependent methyltransferase [Bombardia bombarda]
MSARIMELAQTISASVAEIDKTLSALGLQSPSFDEDAPTEYRPREVSDARDVVLDATAELHDLLLEPLFLVKTKGARWDANKPGHAIPEQQFGLPPSYRPLQHTRHDPPNGQLSFGDIGRRTKLGEQMTCRLLRHAMTMRIFREPTPGMMLDALQKWPLSQEPNQTGYSLSKNTSPTIYDIIGSSPSQSALFASSMVVWARQPYNAPSHPADGYDWPALLSSPDHNVTNKNKTNNKDRRINVLDIGGARGHVAAALASQHPFLDVVVQDMAAIVAGAEQEITPPELVEQKRVRFMAHDLFSAQQPRLLSDLFGHDGDGHEAIVVDVFLLRWVLHNWADKHCVAILRSQIPALRRGARVLVMDACMSDPADGNDDDRAGVEVEVEVLGKDFGAGALALPLWKEREMRYRSEDLNMAAIFNARERTLREWKALFTEADPRLVPKRVIKPEGSALAILEVLWLPSVDER